MTKQQMKDELTMLLNMRPSIEPMKQFIARLERIRELNKALAL